MDQEDQMVGKTRYCAACGESIPDYARPDVIYCSGKCRVRALRAKNKGARLLGDVTGVTGTLDTGYIGVTDNPPPVEPTRLSRLPTKYDEERFPISSDLTIPKFLRREPDAPHWKDYDGL